MAPVAGRPFLSYVIDHLVKEGMHSFIFSVGYKHEAIVDHLHKNYADLNAKFAIEDSPLGTGGATRLACEQAVEKNVLVVNGDTLFKIELGTLTYFHNLCNADCTLALKPMKEFDRYGVVELNEDYSIKSFREKQFYTEGNITGGVYALQAQKFLHEDFPIKFSFEKDYLEKLYSQRRMYGMVQDVYFIDIGIPGDYARAQNELNQQ
jgi:D-glycero-alpha-D-manno-heptose 1-phosphate guanylyltransferase